MHVETTIEGEKCVAYDSRTEFYAAVEAYLAGEWGRLTRLQVQELRECERDPYGVEREGER